MRNVNSTGSLEQILCDKIIEISKPQPFKSKHAPVKNTASASNAVQTANLRSSFFSSFGKKIVITATAGILLASSAGLMFRGCEKRRITQYNTAHRRFMEYVETGSIDEGIKFIEPILSRMLGDDNPEVRELYQAISQSYNNVLQNRARYIEINEKRLFERALSTTQDLFNQNNFSEAYYSLNRIIERLESNSHMSFTHENIADLLEWKEQEVLPSYVEYRIEQASSISDYRLRKHSIDELFSFAEQEEFRDKEQTLDRINGLHEPGINIERAVLSEFMRRFDSIKNDASNRLYVSANSGISSLIRDLDSAGFIYETENLSKLLTEASNYNNRSIRPHMETRTRLLRDARSKFREYDSLLENGSIQEGLDLGRFSDGRTYPGQGLELPYLQAEQDVRELISSLSSLREDREVYNQANVYLSEMNQRILLLRQATFEYFRSETYRWQNLGYQGNSREAASIRSNIIRQLNLFKQSEVYSRE